MQGTTGQQGDWSADGKAGSRRRFYGIKELLEERPELRSSGGQPDRWVRRLLYERRLPFHKVGGRVFIDLGDVDAMLEAGRTEPTR